LPVVRSLPSGDLPSQYLFADPAESTEIRSDAVRDGFTGTVARYAFIQTSAGLFINTF
jgi:hypothetical protein